MSYLLQVVQSRALHAEAEDGAQVYVLAPLLDMINHGGDLQTAAAGQSNFRLSNTR